MTENVNLLHALKLHPQCTNCEWIINVSNVYYTTGVSHNMQRNELFGGGMGSLRVFLVISIYYCGKSSQKVMSAEFVLVVK